MRTRISNTVRSQAFKSDSWLNRGQSVSGPSGSRACLPFSIQEPPTSQYADYLATLGEWSSISDELPGFDGIGNVTHIKKTYPEVSRVKYYVADEVSARTSYNGTQKFYDCNRVNLDAQQYANLITYCNGVGYSNFASLDPSTLGQGGRSDDRLPELIPRIMSRLESLHLANSAFEAREFPSLWKMFRKRQALHRMVDRIHKWAIGSRYKFGAPQFMRDFSKAMRDGTLNYNYGVIPTVADVADIAKEIQHPKTFKSRFVVTVRDDHSLIQEASSTGTTLLRNRRAYNTERCLRVFGARVKYRGSDEEYLSDLFRGLDRFQQRYIGLNPLGAVWESYPLSFLVDYVLSIDNVLDSLFLNNNSRINVQYWSSVKRELQRQGSGLLCSGIQNPGPYAIASSPSILYEYGHQIEVKWTASHYVRSRRDAPSALSSLSPRLSPKKVFLGLLIALGYRR
jgi:hypothetical protein